MSGRTSMAGFCGATMPLVQRTLLSVVVVIAPVLAAFPCCCERAAAELRDASADRAECCDHSINSGATSCCQNESPQLPEPAKSSGSCPPDRDCWCCLPEGYLSQSGTISRPNPIRHLEMAALPVDHTALAIAADLQQSLRPPDETHIKPGNRNQALLCVWRN